MRFFFYIKLFFELIFDLGFGGGCDKVLLESLRSPNGTFRYAEPNENVDSLCNKLTSLFEIGKPWGFFFYFF